MAEGGHSLENSASWQRRIDDVAALLTLEDVPLALDWFGLPERRRDWILQSSNPSVALFQELDKNDELMSGDEETLNQLLEYIGRSDLIRVNVIEATDDDPELTVAIEFLCDRIRSEIDWKNVCRELGTSCFFFFFFFIVL